MYKPGKNTQFPYNQLPADISKKQSRLTFDDTLIVVLAAKQNKRDGSLMVRALLRNVSN
jgi:hypothetical protein